MALYAQPATSLSPGLSSTQSCTNIPSRRTTTPVQQLDPVQHVPRVDDLLPTVDNSTRPVSAPMAAAKSADDLLAARHGTLPIDPLPNIRFYGHVVARVSDNVITGPCWNIDHLVRKSCSCTVSCSGSILGPAVSTGPRLLWE